MRAFIRLSMGLLLGLALMTSCGGDTAGETEVGELGMTLSTRNGDVVYRLRNALFQIRGPENKDVCSEVYKDDQPDEPIIVDLRSGNYQVAMDLGTAGTGGMGGAGPAPGTGGGGGNDCGNWWMEYSASGRAYEPIDAVLVSVNPMDVRINTGETTHVYFRFEVDGRLIDFGPGTLAIGIDVTEEPPIPGVGGAGGDGGTGGTGAMSGAGGTGGAGAMSGAGGTGGSGAMSGAGGTGGSP